MPPRKFAQSVARPQGAFHSKQFVYGAGQSAFVTKTYTCLQLNGEIVASRPAQRSCS